MLQPHFFDVFFQGRPKTEHISIRAIVGRDDLNGSWYPTSIGEATVKINSKKTDTNVYFGVCTRSVPRPDKLSVSTGYAVWVDLDLGSQLLAEKKKILSEFNLIFEPSIVVDSGNGLHLYWLLDKPTNDLELLERTCRNFGISLGGDEVFDRTRIMRVPDTVNLKSGPPGLMVQVLKMIPERRYSLQDLFAVSCIDAKVASRITSGNATGFKSRSHRDWSVVTNLIRCGASDELIQQLFDDHPIGDKSRDNPAYLPHTIKKAHTQYDDETSPNSSKKNAQVSEIECSWFVEKNGKHRQVSTWVYHPNTIIRAANGEPDIFVGTVCTQYGTEYPDIRLKHADFSSAASLASTIPHMDCAWLGSDSEVRLLMPYLFEQFRELGGLAKELRKQTGWYRDHWIGTQQIVSAVIGGEMPAEDCLLTYDQRNDGGGNLEIVYDFETDDELQVRSFFDLVFKINRTAVVAPALGWLAASIFKSRFEPLGFKLPFLNISGTRGAGKTTLIKEVLQPLVGYKKSRTYDCSTTRFVLLSLLGSTTDIFVSLSEYRRSALSETSERNLQRYLLLGYDEGLDPRGRADQTIQNYVISAPITLDGEDMVADPALLERSIHVRMSPDDILGSAEEAFKELSSLNLNQIGSQMILFSLNYDIQKTLNWCEEFTRTTFSELDVIVPSRPTKNITTILFGLRFLEDFAAYFECPLPKFGEYKTIVLDCLGLIIDITSGRTRRTVDDFVEDVVAEASRMLLDFGSSSFSFKYEKGEKDDKSVLYFHLTTAYSWWRKHRRQQGLPALEKRSIEEQLKETASSESARFILNSERVHIEGKPLVCYGVDLTEASKVLDVSPTMSALDINIKLA